MATDITPSKPIASRLIDFLYRTLDALARRPTDLFATLLALNALALPYANLIHDARLYGAQVLNRWQDNYLAQDLFFRYGSQDRFSVFSMVVAPLVGWFGLEPSFFILYLIFNALFLLALQRLVRALIEDRMIATLALLGMSVTLIPFGGLGVFHVNENFLTPRVIANALVLFAMERILRDRLKTAGLLLSFAMLMHPLMAVSGFAILIAWWAMDHLKPALLIGLATVLALAGAVLLSYEPLGVRIFGLMDAEWLSHVRRVNPYNFPEEWDAEDCLSIVMSSLFVLTSTLFLIPNRRSARLLLLILVAALGGLGTMALASHLPYALLLQVQPYRALWLLQILQIPLGLLIVAHCWTTERLLGRCLALVIIMYLGLRALGNLELLFLFGTTPLFLIAYHGLRATPREKDWLWQTLVSSCCTGVVLWFAFKIFIVIDYWGQLNNLIAPFDVIRVFQAVIDPLLWCLISLGLVACALRWTGIGFGYRVAMVGLFVLLQTTFFEVPRLSFYETHWKKNQQDIEFVAHFLDHERGDSKKVPTVYWSLGKADCIWFDLGTNSYFEWTQIVGNLFSRNNALEGHRRALLVKRFEMDRYRKEAFALTDRTKKTITEIFEADLKEPPPTLEDLYKLCQERDVDYVIVKQRFDGLYVCDNGTYYIYDCAKLRSEPHVGHVQVSSKNTDLFVPVVETPGVATRITNHRPASDIQSIDTTSN